MGKGQSWPAQVESAAAQAFLIELGEVREVERIILTGLKGTGYFDLGAGANNDNIHSGCFSHWSQRALR